MDDDGKDNIDQESNFEEWLKSLKISDKIINKLKNSDMDSMLNYLYDPLYSLSKYI